MNALEKFIIERKLNPVEAMNHLQDVGLISDHAITAADVAHVDVFPARDYLVKFVKCTLCGELRSKCHC